MDRKKVEGLLAFLEKTPQATYDFTHSYKCAYAQYSGDDFGTFELNQVFPGLADALAGNRTFGDAAKEVRKLLGACG